MRILTFIAIAMVALSCSKGTYDLDKFTPVYGNGTDYMEEYMEQVAAQKIYFGHQSVGRNILSGLEAWQKETGVSMPIMESRDFSMLPDSAFVHFAVGANGDPKGKVDDFAALVEQIGEEEQALAFFKFCYADFSPETDIEDLFTYYRDHMIKLHDNHPHIRFIASTVPILGVQSGPRALAKKILGRAPYGAEINMKLQEFNAMIKNDLAGIMPVFDLAATESTRPDGSIETYRYKGEEHPCVPQYYRSDFGHLNEAGARIVSYNLLAFLAEELK